MFTQSSYMHIFTFGGKDFIVVNSHVIPDQVLVTQSAGGGVNAESCKINIYIILTKL